MKAILDTHIFLWWNINDPQLSEALREIISDGRNQLFLSAASTWEIAIKAGRARLSLPGPPGKFVANRLTMHSFQPLAVQLIHAFHVYNLPDHHCDPFDRLLIAQGQMEDMLILTTDPNFAQYDVKTAN